jgi:RNA polymerase sigma factor (sigma-70 family)
MTRPDEDTDPGDERTPRTSDDDSSIERLLERHLAALRAFVRLRAGPRVRAFESEADLVQSVCRELLAKRSRFDFRGDSAFRSWLYTAALRKVVEKDRYHSAGKRDVARRARADSTGDVLDCYAVLATPSQDLAAREQMERIERAFERLSEDHREVLSLARIAGLPSAEVARLMGRSEVACRQLLRRAQVRLAMLLELDG